MGRGLPVCQQREKIIKNRHSSMSDINTWAQDCFGKPSSRIPQYLVTSTNTS